MPYIKSGDGRREALQRGEPALTAGELNYQIHFEFKNVNLVTGVKKPTIEMYAKFFLGESPNYQRYNDMAGCLILCAKEIKRRLNIDVKDMFNEIIDSYDEEIAKYEDIKIITNGDV